MNKKFRNASFHPKTFITNETAFIVLEWANKCLKQEIPSCPTEVSLHLFPNEVFLL